MSNLAQQPTALIATRRYLAGLVCSSLAALAIGCGSDASTSTSSATQTTVASASRADSATIGTSDGLQANGRSALVGVWLGTAWIDQSKFADFAQTLPPDQQAAITTKVRSFLSTVMAVEYAADGQVENEVELMTVNGQLLRDGSVGRWELVAADANRIVVRVLENLASGEAQDDVVYERLAGSGGQGGQRLAMHVDVDSELVRFDAKVIFERQDLSPVSNVAESPSKGEVK